VTGAQGLKLFPPYAPIKTTGTAKKSAGTRHSGCAARTDGFDFEINYEAEWNQFDVNRAAYPPAGWRLIFKVVFASTAWRPS